MDPAAAPPDSSASQMQPTLIASIVIWILIMTLLFVLYMCAAFNRHRSRRMNLDALLDDNGVQIQNRRGLERSVVDSLPIFVYSKGEDSKGGLECAICLSEYEEGAKGRRLNCGHRFHASCIDAWFESHCSCPVCRSTVVCCNSKGLDLDLDLDLGASDSQGLELNGSSSSAKQPPTESSTPSHNVIIHIQELATSSASQSFKMDASPSTVRDLKLLLLSASGRPPDSNG